MIVATGDSTPCGTQPGVVLRLGLGGISGATPFQIPDIVFDLCNRDILCTGRQPRACGLCNDTVGNDQLCLSDDGQGNFPCPPNNLVFFCKDPCAGSGTDFQFFSELDVPTMRVFFGETRQPLPQLMRTALQGQGIAPAGAGGPVVYHTEELSSGGSPPVERLCVRVLFTTQEKPLGACASDVRITCATAADCPSGDTCLDGTPAMLNPSSSNGIVSTSTCSGGSRAGLPCAGAGDCTGGSCVALTHSAAGKFCSASFTACTDASQCPGGESCISCPGPACGDGVVDPGEECDDGNTTSGDGCDATCHQETCFTCEGTLGERSQCFPSDLGTACDLDGTPCTLDQCDGFGDCIAGGAPTSCDTAASGKAQLQFKRDAAKPAKSKLKWKWVSNAAFATSSLGDPSTTDALSFCVFDSTGFAFGATAPAGGMCGKKPCWDVAPDKIKFNDKDATPDGLTKLQAKSGKPGKGKAQLQGKGEHLVLPSAQLTLPVQTFLLRGNGPACLQATYSTADDNAPGEFKGSSD